MTTHENNPHVAFNKLNRILIAAVDAIARHSDNEVIAAAGAPLGAIAEEFGASCEALEVAYANQKEALLMRDKVVALLDQSIGSWTGPLSRDIAGFDASRFASRSNAPLDVVSDARKLVELIEAKGGALAYGERAKTLLAERAEVAFASCSTAQDARTALQTTQATTRELAAKVQPHLIALRQVMRSELGPQHYDYQRLRVDRVRTEVEETEEETQEPSSDQAKAS
jgi:hypothetical protein